jgi:hypothetical protein
MASETVAPGVGDLSTDTFWNDGAKQVVTT